MTLFPNTGSYGVLTSGGGAHVLAVLIADSGTVARVTAVHSLPLGFEHVPTVLVLTFTYQRLFTRLCWNQRIKKVG